MKRYFVYILASKPHGTLYIGMTNNLVRRTYEHIHGDVHGFTKKYTVHHLVYYEIVEEAKIAIQREKQLKKWNRSWKIRLIQKYNPQWNDLYETII